MEDITPGELGYIALAAILVTIASQAYHFREEWLPWAFAIWDRYFVVRLPASPEALRGKRDYVELAPFPAFAENAGNPHSQALEPVRNAPIPTAAEPVPSVPDLLPLDINECYEFDDIIECLALLKRVRMPDGTIGEISQDKLVALIGGRREAAMLRVKELRGAGEPVDPEYQFSQIGKRQSFQRTGVKPVR
jgi:hypothetical protein